MNVEKVQMLRLQRGEHQISHDMKGYLIDLTWSKCISNHTLYWSLEHCTNFSIIIVFCILLEKQKTMLTMRLHKKRQVFVPMWFQNMLSQCTTEQQHKKLCLGFIVDHVTMSIKFWVHYVTPAIC